MTEKIIEISKQIRKDMKHFVSKAKEGNIKLEGENDERVIITLLNNDKTRDYIHKRVQEVNRKQKQRMANFLRMI